MLGFAQIKNKRDLLSLIGDSLPRAQMFCPELVRKSEIMFTKVL